MFKAEISNSKLLKSAFDAVGEINDEVKIVIDSDGLRINTMDKGNHLSIRLELKNTLFDEFVCDEPESLVVDMDKIMKILKLTSADDRVILSNDDYKLIVTLEGDGESTFKISLIDEEYEDKTPPEIDFPVVIDIETKLIDNMIKRVTTFTQNSMKFNIDSDYLNIYTNEDMMVDINNKFLHGEKVNETAESSYGVDKVLSIMKGKTFSDSMKLKLGNDMPLGVEFELVSEEGILSYLLAPRIEKEG